MLAIQTSNKSNERRSGILLKKLLLPNPKFKLHREYSAQRKRVESYIAEHFRQKYDAKIASFLPMLLSMQCQSGYSAAMGIRSAAHAELFLEQYLDNPVETTLEQSLNIAEKQSVSRDQVVEIGNLVATRRGASQLMFVLVAAALIKTDARWMVFTATPQVEKILRRLKFNTVTLCEADRNKLSSPQQREQWGKYYNTRPQVLAGDLTQVYELIENNRLLRYVVNHYRDVVQNLASYLQP